MNRHLQRKTPPLTLAPLMRQWLETDFYLFKDGLYDELISGGVPRDGIPPLDDPVFESVEEAALWLHPQSPVVSLTLDGMARAYPLAILTRHEIVNDVVAGCPVAVTFCPLCNSAVVFDRLVDGQVLRFGVSGLLRNSDLIMWDDVTQSWWQQFTGEGLVGAYTGVWLTMRPSQIVGFGAFARQYPHGEVLSRQERTYGTNPYVGYDSATQPFLFRAIPDRRLPATERILGAVKNQQAWAYPFSRLQQWGVINDTLDDCAVVVVWQAGAASALDRSSIDASRDVGMAALYSRQVKGQCLTFSQNDQGTVVDQQTGSTWTIFGTALSGPLVGERLQQELAFSHFWFAWTAFHPQTRVYGE